MIYTKVVNTAAYRDDVRSTWGNGAICIIVNFSLYSYGKFFLSKNFPSLFLKKKLQMNLESILSYLNPLYPLADPLFD